MILQVPDGVETGLGEEVVGDLSHPMQGPTGQGSEERNPVGIPDDGQPVGLLEIASELGE
jgi:hypothetical protein